MCIATFIAGIAVTLAVAAALALCGLVIAAQVNDVLREIERGPDL